MGRSLARPLTLLVAWLAVHAVHAHPLDERVRQLFAEPPRMLRLVPMKLSHLDELKTKWALERLFGTATLGALAIRDLPANPGFHDLDIGIENVDLFGLKIATLQIEARGVRFDPAELAQERLVVANAFKATMKATVTEEDLNRAAGNYHIELMKDTFRLEGESKVLFIESDFSLDGRLKIGEGNQVLLVPKALQYGVVPIPRMLLKRVLSGINPLFDLNKFLGSVKTWVDLDLTDPVLEEDRVVTVLGGRITPLDPAGADRITTGPPPAMPGTPGVGSLIGSPRAPLRGN